MESQNEVNSEATPRRFNRDAEFTVKILSGGAKSCKVKYPTDAQWIARAAKVKTITHILGRDKSYVETPAQKEASAELFEAVRIDKDGDPFDAAEAWEVIARIERAVVSSVAPCESGFRVGLKVPNAETMHECRIPLQSELDAYNDDALKSYRVKETVESRARLEPAGRLYDSIIVSSTGYVGSVPIIHKAAVVAEVYAQVQAFNAEQFDPEV